MQLICPKYCLVIGLLFFTIGIAPVLFPNNSPNLFKRKVRGVFENLAHPGYGTCGRCGRPWCSVNEHSTPYYSGGRCFPLCEQCWSELTPYQRLPYYRDLIDKWMSYGEPDHMGQAWDDIWKTLEANVLAGE